MSKTGLLGSKSSLPGQIVLGSATIGNTTYFLAAAVDFALASAPDGINIGDKLVDAASGLAFATPATGFGVGPKPVFASNHTWISASAQATRYLPRSAASYLFMFDLADEYVSPILLSAANSFSLAAEADFSLTAVWQVAAASGFRFRAKATETANYVFYVAAESDFTLAGAASEVAVRVLSAASGLALGTGAHQGRDLYATAVTSVGLGVTDQSNRFFWQAADCFVALATAAGVQVSGTLAGSALALRVHARAIVWFPWRRVGLALPPGGNLPHS